MNGLKRGKNPSKVKQVKHNLSPPVCPAFVCCFKETASRTESYQKYHHPFPKPSNLNSKMCVQKSTYTPIKSREKGEQLTPPLNKQINKKKIAFCLHKKRWILKTIQKKKKKSPKCSLVSFWQVWSLLSLQALSQIKMNLSRNSINNLRKENLETLVFCSSKTELTMPSALPPFSVLCHFQEL